ncbi:cytochrome P450 reductase 2 [Massarina eburnea CBS 473.64]|uniref:NADPH--cytochrome P450 reductase n=1 Tax=Massarina eburnea CBS 473.64 TaxID=1395130 RepID=A0A6A6SEU5_9PLEO|nr:cytochrome P450 reductase 2 [Massarina eburnea CBS 473.64]
MDISELQSTLHLLFETLQGSPVFKSLRPVSIADRVVLLLFLLSTCGYLTRGHIWDRPDPNYGAYFERPQLVNSASSNKTIMTRNIYQRIEDGDYQVVIFWGSQSGTAERFAEVLGRECSTRFGINAMVADLSDYDAESISEIQKPYFAIFILSTYGEGDPSDNAVGLWDWIKRIKDQSTKLENLQYLALGLGNSNYKYYNRVLDVVVDAFDAAGATALIPAQRADDAVGATEEDFQSWKDEVFSLLRERGYEQKTATYQATLNVWLRPNSERHSDVSQQVSISHQQSTTCSTIYPLPIRSSRELFTAGDRNCIHMELELGNNDILYKTGDHVGIWPCNPDEEIERLLKVLGLKERRNDALDITVLDDSAKPKVPRGNTLESALRHHLEICALVSRKTILNLSQFAPTPSAKAILSEIGQDRELYAQLASSTHITLARLLQLASPVDPWTSLPLSFIIENLLALQPRYYSISSSSIVSPRCISITALVVNKVIDSETPESIQGLTSNYILSASKLQSKASLPTPSFQHTASPTLGSTLYAHVRKSKFKLPLTSSTPLILVAAGTGFAPFRAFLSERAKLHTIGKPIGRMILFFGCRNPDSDYIYREELGKLQDTLGEALKIVTAFSRDQAKKVYVQDRVSEYGNDLLEMLDSGANMYICGKASMAREVDGKIEDAVKRIKGLEQSGVKVWVDDLKRRGKWRADVWG